MVATTWDTPCVPSAIATSSGLMRGAVRSLPESSMITTMTRMKMKTCGASGACNVARIVERTALANASRPRFPHAMLQARDVSGTGRAVSALAWHPVDDKPLPPSRPVGEPQSITFSNSRNGTVELIWLGADGARRSYRIFTKARPLVFAPVRARCGWYSTQISRCLAFHR